MAVDDSLPGIGKPPSWDKLNCLFPVDSPPAKPMTDVHPARSRHCNCVWKNCHSWQWMPCTCNDSGRTSDTPRPIHHYWHQRQGALPLFHVRTRRQAVLPNLSCCLCCQPSGHVTLWARLPCKNCSCLRESDTVCFAGVFFQTGHSCVLPEGTIRDYSKVARSRDHKSAGPLLAGERIAA